MKKIILLLTIPVTFLLMFIVNSLYAQTIDSLKIIPFNPTHEDTIKIICFSTFSNSSCFLTGSNFNINDSLLEIQAYHQVGGYPAFCNSIDTISIGIINAGSYMVIYNLIDSINSNSDIDTTYFIVSHTNKIKNFQISNALNFITYPNPVNDNLIIRLDSQGINNDTYKITIINMYGQNIYEQYTKNNKLIINSKLFSIKGIYLIKVEYNNNLYINRIVKI